MEATYFSEQYDVTAVVCLTTNTFQTWPFEITDPSHFSLHFVPFVLSTSNPIEGDYATLVYSETWIDIIFPDNPVPPFCSDTTLNPRRLNSAPTRLTPCWQIEHLLFFRQSLLSHRSIYCLQFPVNGNTIRRLFASAFAVKPFAGICPTEKLRGGTVWTWPHTSHLGIRGSRL